MRSRGRPASSTASRRDTLTFSETLEFQGNTVPITYRGVVAGDVLRL